ncbi:hypothetical protein D3C76_1281230 [compost metagenome]
MLGQRIIDNIPIFSTTVPFLKGLASPNSSGYNKTPEFNITLLIPVGSAMITLQISKKMDSKMPERVVPYKIPIYAGINPKFK